MVETDVRGSKKIDLEARIPVAVIEGDIAPGNHDSTPIHIILQGSSVKIVVESELLVAVSLFQSRYDFIPRFF
jgi:hypothetical protein